MPINRNCQSQVVDSNVLFRGNGFIRLRFSTCQIPAGYSPRDNTHPRATKDADGKLEIDRLRRRRSDRFQKRRFSSQFVGNAIVDKNAARCRRFEIAENGV